MVSSASPSRSVDRARLGGSDGLRMGGVEAEGGPVMRTAPARLV